MQPLNRSALLSDIRMTPAVKHACPANSTRFRISPKWNAALIFFAAILVFASSLNAKFFEDEYAYISQSYYADLCFTRQFNHKLWLDWPAIDLQPLPKCLIGLAFRVAHLPMPGPADAWKWYKNYHTFGGAATLRVARMTVIPFGALGCLALFACGARLKDARTGTLAAIFLMIDPLFSQQAHRAMADVPCEAFMLASLAIGLSAWARIWAKGPGISTLILAGLAGLVAGMALLCKLNGFVSLAIVLCWCGIAWLVPRLSIGRRLAMTGLAIVTIGVALGAAVAFNPYLTAKPVGKLPVEVRELQSKDAWQRFRHQVDKRREVSDGQKERFPDDALFDITEKARVVFVQGFGRFGPFGPRSADSRVRYDFTQDLGMVLWLPLVLVGLRESIRLGCTQLRDGKPPFGLALVAWAVCGWTVVMLYLPMAWDRYQLPIQSGNSLLAAVGIMCLWDRLALALVPRLQIARA
jgi:4-amino-4-deoxy-L-arabinose transferase-like glycosyltransferase